MKNILIVEDDKVLNNGIAFNFQCDGFNTISVFNINDGREQLNKNKIDMIVLDVNLPDGSGFDFCKEVREKYNMPILFLTALDMELDIITGFKLGADDYITKPFSLNILRERVLALFRRYNRETISEEILEVDGFTFNFDKMTVSKGGEPIVLAPTEYKILKKLVISKGKILSRGMLLEEIWDKDSEYIEEHALTVNINRLRNKIEGANSKGKFIKTIYGIGYTWSGENNE
ncbi:response regulator transcription factor [Clostridium sp.]|uniref:response regulator transcription factor n=1 Tax=Clostridium sp. TaxID=1506 RepID=UPI003F3C4162